MAIILEIARLIALSIETGRTNEKIGTTIAIEIRRRDLAIDAGEFSRASYENDIATTLS